ncbi:hypothetical protein OCU04_006407 [Sclerotinia nivalis]|uniref:Myb-like domain-containing protein n=1 Tax=Sclerotinia nivalis TaxID=352851 RepID=A0A9X0AMW6_9HELO|nr:hypothetical protein OCU04_006407 [Sclerotinia nivalis]
MMFTKPAERCLDTMSESSVKKALCIVASYVYSQEGGIQWLNDQLSQFGCTADGLINEILIDPELTQHPVGQELHHKYRLHNNPNDEDAAAYQVPATSTGGKGKSAHPPQKTFAYAPIHPQALVEQAIILHGEDYAGFANSDEQPVEEKALVEAAESETPENETPIVDYDYVDNSATKYDELTHEQQFALTVEASLKEQTTQKYNGEASGTNGELTASPSQQNATSSAHSSGGMTDSSTARFSSEKQILAASPHATPFPSPAHTPCSSPPPLNKRGHSGDDDSDDKEPARRPAKRLKKSNTKSSASASASTSSTTTTTSTSSSRTSRKATTPSSTRRPSWTPEETEQVYKCLVARREKEASIPGLIKLYDAPLWLHISEALAGVYGIHRTPSGCKANWNRSGRGKYGFDERSALKRSEALATSLQVSKKDGKKKGKKVVEEEDDDDDDGDE